MPLPEPKPEESEDAFVKRCMSDEVMKNEFSKNKQRYAVCMKQYNKKNEENTMDILERIDKYLNEGTWASPNTKKKAKELEKLMRSPMTPPEAKKKLYNIVGSDDFHDRMNDTFRKEDQNKDVRWFIADWIKNNWLTQAGQNSFVRTWDKDAYDIVKKVVDKYSK